MGLQARLIRHHSNQIALSGRINVQLIGTNMRGKYGNERGIVLFVCISVLLYVLYV